MSRRRHEIAEIETMRDDVERAVRTNNILVANAGAALPARPLEEISEEGWHASIDGNLTATFLTIKSILPGMKHGKRATSSLSRRGGAATLSQSPFHTPRRRRESRSLRR